MCREDPSLSYHVTEETDEIVLRGMGAFHLEISISRLESEHRIKNIFQYPMRVDYREVPTHPANISHEQQVTFQKKNFRIHLEYQIRPNGQADFTTKNVKLSATSVAEVIEGDRLVLDWSKNYSNFRKVIENGFLMGSMTGPVDGNPLVGFDIEVKRLDSVGHRMGHIKGMVLQKLIIKSMAAAFRSASVEIKEPKMEFELSLYRLVIINPCSALTAV